MPQLQSVVLKDRKTPTPTDHTFVPRDISSSGVGTVVESSGVPIGDSRLAVFINPPTSTGRRKGGIRLAVPIVQDEVVSGISRPTVVRVAYAEVAVNFDQTSSEQERADVLGMLESALKSDKALINDTLVKLQGVY